VNKTLSNGAKAEIRVIYDERNQTLKIDGVGVITKGKRKMTYIGDHRITDNYAYRILNFEDREKVLFKAYVEAIGIDTLNEALDEAWYKIKPQPISSDLYNIDFDVSKFI